MRKLPMTALNRKTLLISAKLAGMSVHDRRNLAEETKSALELLLVSKDRSPYVRAGLVFNDRTPSSVLKRLAQEISPGIRFAVLQHHNTPTNCAKLLEHDKDKAVRGFAELLLTIRKKRCKPKSTKKKHEDWQSEGGKETDAKTSSPDHKKGEE